MSFTSPTTTATGGTTPTTGPGSTSSASTPTISSNEFLQLLMTELQNQNPMDPSSSDPMQFMTELAQFTSVEQETDTAQSTTQMAGQQATSSAVALIGHTVSYTDPSTGAAGSGLVQSVQVTSSGATITVNGTPGIAPSSVTQVS